MPRVSIMLAGYRGSGKTEVGRRLAERLWQTFVDVDELIVRRAGKTIAAIFASDGEEAFRDLEQVVIREVCLLQDHVIALGGGSLMRPANRQAIAEAGHKIIYLRCEAEELLRRIEGDAMSAANRPALTALGGGLEEIASKLGEREPVYRQCMHAELDVTHLGVDEAVVYITRLL